MTAEWLVKMLCLGASEFVIGAEEDALSWVGCSRALSTTCSPSRVLDMAAESKRYGVKRPTTICGRRTSRKGKALPPSILTATMSRYISTHREKTGTVLFLR